MDAKVARHALSPELQATLAERIGRDVPEAREEFARLFQPRVLLMLQARLRDREAARELASDVLMAALGALRKGQLREGEKLSSFVYGIARNLVNNHLRGVYARPLDVPIEETHAVVDPYAEMEHAQRVESLRGRSRS